MRRLEGFKKDSPVLEVWRDRGALLPGGDCVTQIPREQHVFIAFVFGWSSGLWKERHAVSLDAPGPKEAGMISVPPDTRPAPAGLHTYCEYSTLR